MSRRVSTCKSHRVGIKFMELTDMFPDEATAKAWIEARMVGAA